MSPFNLRQNILNNINNNINNNTSKVFEHIEPLSSLIDENKKHNKIKQPKRPQKNNIDFANSLNNNELITNNTNDNSLSPVSSTLLQKAMKTADRLIIEITNSLSFDKNFKIEINPLGMVQGSKRKANDGFTYFGLVEEDDQEYNDDNNDNKDNKGKDVDFEINSNEINTNTDNSNLIGRHFRIRFDINTMKYYIKDLGLGYGTFKKIVKKATLKDTYLINIGNSYIVCTFGVDEYYPEGKGSYVEMGEKTLNIKVFSDSSQTEPYFFNPNQSKRIYIGRDIFCNIIIDDSLLSRIHCTIDYTEDEGWVIYDGKIDEDESKNRPSTNGTWLFLIEETEITDGLLFKNNKTAFECQIIKQSQEIKENPQNEESKEK